MEDKTDEIDEDMEMLEIRINRNNIEQLVYILIFFAQTTKKHYETLDMCVLVLQYRW